MKRQSSAKIRRERVRQQRRVLKKPRKPLPPESRPFSATLHMIGQPPLKVP
jgi:hypothetical protein